jgi:TPR repeat protein
MRVMLSLYLLGLAFHLSAAPGFRPSKFPLPVAKRGTNAPAVKAAKTNEPPALVKARKDVLAAISDRDLFREAYEQSKPNLYPGDPMGEVMRSYAAERYLKLGMANTAGGRMAMGDLRFYIGDMGLWRDWQAAEREVARRQAVVRAMLGNLRQAEMTNSTAFKAGQAKVEMATVKFLAEQAEAGSARAKFDLGERYLAGRGVEADEPKGWGYIHAAADLGHEPAQARWVAHLKEQDEDAKPETVVAP